MAVCLQSPFKLTSSPPFTTPTYTHRRSTITPSSSSSSAAVSADPAPMLTSVTAFAPATVANLGPGFDFLGCAVDGIGDRVTISPDDSVAPGRLHIASISGTTRPLSRDPLNNCAGIAAIEVIS